ncbi:PAS domain-containing hybrid sensor histidine kinase/response regulator [Opitutus terrae]|nr:hybrid sensor histidine kinase/response regulator [Opitutus terrae]
MILWIAALVVAFCAGFAAAWWHFRRERNVFVQELRSLWERLDAIFYRSPLAISLCEPDQEGRGVRLVDCNEQSCALRGGSRDQVLGREFQPAVNGDAAAMSAWLRSPQPGAVWRGETLLRRTGGDDVPIAYVWSWVEIGGRQLVLAVERDVTEQRRAEAAWKDSEQRFRQIVASANCLLWKARVREIDGKLAWSFQVPMSALRLRLFEAAELPATEKDLWGPCNIPEIEDMHRLSWAALHADAPSYRQEFRIVTARETLWLHEQVEIERVNATEWNLVGVVMDITRLKEAESATRVSEERNQLVLQASNDGIWDYDVVAHRLEASERCRTMLGLSASEMPTTAEGWRGLIHPDDLPVEKAAWEKHRGTGEPCVYQARFRHHDGSWCWLLVGVITVTDEAGNLTRVVGSHTDITDLKRRDGELQQSRRLRAIGELVGGIAHEFNNLLTPMLLQTTMIRDGIAPAGPVGDQLKPVIAAITEARDLTQRILTFGRRASVNPETLDFVAVVNDNLELLRHTIDRRVRIELQPTPKARWILQNRTDVAQIVINLVLNARDTLLEKAARHAPPGWSPLIHVEFADGARPPAGSRSPHEAASVYHQLTVRDNGMGMADEVRERIFEPFYTTKEVGQGTGLGLATVWHLIKTMGGRVEVETQVGHGSAFHVLLPATAAPADKPGLPPAIAHTMLPGRTARVLLADDQPQVAATLSRILQRWGHNVTVACDGGAALRMLATPGNHYDLCITDVNMPGATGFEVARSIRERSLRMKVVIVGGYLTPQVRRTLTELNIDAMVPKPFTMDDIAAAMRVCGW